ncbi:hypothetical protein ACWDX9_49195, partial [Nonomuraea sp. NPDC003201]
SFSFATSCVGFSEAGAGAFSWVSGEISSWKAMTDAGVAAGFALGGGVTAVLVVEEQAGVKMGVLTSNPAPVAVPVAFAAMVMISLVTPGRMPRGVGRMMARMHLPEHLAGPRDYRSSQHGDRSS